MKVWIVEVGEPLPIDEGAPRIMRAGLLAAVVAEMGHDVTWWTAAFSHSHKTMRTRGCHRVEVGDGHAYRLVTLGGIGYRGHISPRRFLDQRITARLFARRARHEDRPDVVLVGLPTVELARAVARVCVRADVPFLVDIRDLWPDLLYDRFGSRLVPLMKILGWPMSHDADVACRAATGIVGTSDEYVSWGLDRAGRARRDTDRSFPLAYRKPVVDAAARASGEAFWSRHGVDGSRPIIAFVGNLNHQMDFTAVIAAAGELESHPTRPVFVIAGEGPARAEVLALAEGRGSVVMPGWIDADAIAWLLEHAAVGIAPYKPIENYLLNLPNKVIEYLSFGCPVVSSLGDGIVGRLAAVEGLGASYAIDDSRSFLDALAPFLDDSTAREEASRAAARVFDERYRADAVYRDLAEHLLGLVERPVADPPPR